ncbi:MAG: Gfo/Idh/MocA family oxidoreductase [Verrucomicrobiota bacterium]
MNPNSVNPKIIRVAIIGLQHLHPRSYMLLLKSMPSVEVVAVFDSDENLRETFCKDFGLRGYGTLEALLAKERPDIAAIFLPHDQCPEAAEKCAAQGIHLMVEKPMAADVAGAERIVQAAGKAGVHLTTGYVWRLHPVAQEFKRLIESGIAGRIVGVEGRCAAGRLSRYIEGHSPWILQRAHSGGGPMYNLGVHWIDLFRWLLTDEVVEVSGRNVKVNTEYDIEDNSFAHLRFSNGAIAALDISYTVPYTFPYGRDLYISVRGTLGVISWAPAYEGQRDTLFICSDHPACSGAPRREWQYELQPTPGYSGHMGKEYVRRFMEAVRGGQPPPISGGDGVAALKVVEAIYRSDAEKRWVSL